MHLELLHDQTSILEFQLVIIIIKLTGHLVHYVFLVLCLTWPNLVFWQGKEYSYKNSWPQILLWIEEVIRKLIREYIKYREIGNPTIECKWGQSPSQFYNWNSSCSFGIKFLIHLPLLILLQSSLLDTLDSI